MTDLSTITPLQKAIRERRSIKTGYTDEPVEKTLVMDLLRDAVWAPNHGLREPWRFVYVSAEEKEAFVEGLLGHYAKREHENRRKLFMEPAAYLIVIMKEDPRQKQQDENMGAIGSMIQNFQLLAAERQLGTVWKTNPHIYEPDVRGMLGVKAGERIAGFLHLGYYEEKNKPKRKEPTPPEELTTDFSSL
ncbi:nitroreductase [Bacillus daqingensis]|uniref:Nitroreductase n=1 Tax=Bacillus daqingensis TaxID=872396 RepID=A0ABV9NRS5_9BACI